MSTSTKESTTSTTISTEAPKTTPKEDQTPQDCDFNTDFCGWKNKDNDSNKWFLNPGDNTHLYGPVTDITSLQSNLFSFFYFIKFFLSFENNWILFIAEGCSFPFALGYNRTKKQNYCSISNDNPDQFICGKQSYPIVSEAQDQILCNLGNLFFIL